MRLLVAGGGTGGHVTPIVAVIKAFQAMDPQAEILWLGQKKSLEEKFAKNNNISFKTIPAGKVRRYFSLRNIVDLIRAPFGVMSAWFKIGGFKPDVVFGKGGYVSYPVGLAANLRGVPLVIHESDSVPGAANQRLAGRAAAIAVAYDEAKPYFTATEQERIFITGNPLRPEIYDGNRERGLQEFGLSADKPVLFITGGSQGAQALNDAIAAILPNILEFTQVIHQVGEKNIAQFTELGQQYYETGYRAYPFIDKQMADAYASASAIISRASANTLSEISAWQIPAIIIPLPTAARDHQRQNALVYGTRKAAIVLEQENLIPRFFLQKINEVMSSQELRDELKNNIANLYQPEAANLIAKKLWEVGQINSA
ncbi:undecaprenyldiphospho-muramoylpentapeptide beta-N-acetylglucosaminyltransferase [Patescibacteria group bacterium]